MFVNDIPESIITIFLRMFADDVKMIVESSDLQNTQKDLNTLLIWQSLWELEFNLTKCKFLHVGPAENVPSSIL